jgi:hypothetical protein
MAVREKNRFMAMRIAQTELARAHQSQVAQSLMADPRVEVVQVMMNPTHPRRDICDLHSTADLWGLGVGCYPKEKAPQPPFHPFCLCRLRQRPSLRATMAKQAPAGEAAYLRSLGKLSLAGQVMGSKAKAEAVLNGAAFDEVVNTGRDPLYRLVRLMDGVVKPVENENTANHSGATSFSEAAIRSPREKQPPFVLSALSEAAIARASLIGIDLRGKQVALDHDGILHIHKQHGSDSEIGRGQVPVIPSDMSVFDMLLNTGEFNLGKPPKAKDGTTLIAGWANLNGWRYDYVAKVRRLHVVPYTLFKRKNK